jgi:hypothetical protein
VVYRMIQAIVAVGLVLGAVGASCDNISPNVYTPLTDPVTMAIINATPYRAVFVGGAFDNLNQKSVPQVGTVLLESQTNAPDTKGVIWLQTTSCRRALSIGSPELLKLIKDQNVTVSNKKALVNGVNFSDAPLGSDFETNPTQGTAQPLTVLQGVDYPCGSLVIFRMVQDASAEGGFKIVLDGVVF